MKRKRIDTKIFGSLVIVWAGFNGKPIIVRLILSNPAEGAEEKASRLFPRSAISSCAEIDAIESSIQRFLAGDDIEYPLDIVELSQCSPFQRSVLKTEHKIPRGNVSSYLNIAKHIGNPKGARAVGTALAQNPFPLIIPCHRAIRSDRSLGGFQGGMNMKRALLEKEGLAFDSTGRIICDRLYYERT